MPHKGATEDLGWAWAGEVDAVAANSLSQFVAGTLRNKVADSKALLIQTSSLQDVYIFVD